MPRTVNGVAIIRAGSLEDVKDALEAFLSCLIIIRGCIDQIPVFLNAFWMLFNVKLSF
jgi:hypothetical protein